MEDTHTDVSEDEAAVSAPRATMGSPVRRPPRRPLIEVGLPVLAIGILVLLLPFFLPSFVSSLVTKMMIYGLFGMSLNIIWGYAGIPSFGHAAFFGVGGYAAGVFVLKVGISNFWVSLLLAIIVTAIVAAILGVPAFRVFGVGAEMPTPSTSCWLRSPSERSCRAWPSRSARSRAVPPVWPAYQSPTSALGRT